MNNLKNPILCFREPANEAPEMIELAYNVILGEHLPSADGSISKYNFRNTSTLVTLTREAADSSEGSR